MSSQQPEVSVRRECWPINFSWLSLMYPAYVVARDAWATDVILCDAGHILYDTGLKGGPWIVRSFNDWVPEEICYRETGVTRIVKTSPMFQVFFEADDVIEATFNVKDAKEVFSIMGALRR